MIDDDEQCDGANLNEHTCTDFDFVGGELGCTSTCQFDTTGCTNCGNDVIDDGEECDGIDFGDKTCAGFGYAGGELDCTDQCVISLTKCVD